MALSEKDMISRRAIAQLEELVKAWKRDNCVSSERLDSALVSVERLRENALKPVEKAPVEQTA